MTDLFTRHVREIILDKRFLNDMDPRSLRALRSRIAEVLVQPHVKEGLAHEWKDLHEFVERLTFDTCLPSPPKPRQPNPPGLYRRKYDETVTVTISSLGTFLLQLGIPKEGVSEQALATRVSRQETHTDYQMVSPRDDVIHLVRFSLRNLRRSSRVDQVCF